MDQCFQKWLTIMDFKDIFLLLFTYDKQIFDYALILSWFYATLERLIFLFAFRAADTSKWNC